jgi:hypothetical protein
LTTKIFYFLRFFDCVVCNAWLLIWY